MPPPNGALLPLIVPPSMVSLPVPFTAIPPPSTAAVLLEIVPPFRFRVPVE